MGKNLRISSVLDQVYKNSFKGSGYDLVIFLFRMLANIFMEDGFLKFKILIKCSQKGKARTPFIVFSQKTINIFTNIDDSLQLVCR